MTEWSAEKSDASAEHDRAFIPPRALTAEHREIWVALMALMAMQPRGEMLKAIQNSRRTIKDALDVEDAFTRMFGREKNSGDDGGL